MLPSSENIGPRIRNGQQSIAYYKLRGSPGAQSLGGHWRGVPQVQLDGPGELSAFR